MTFSPSLSVSVLSFVGAATFAFLTFGMDEFSSFNTEDELGTGRLRFAGSGFCFFGPGFTSALTIGDLFELLALRQLVKKA